MTLLYKPLLIDSIKAQTDLPKQRFIGLDGNICMAGTKAFGICDVETESGQFAPIAISGILLVETGANIDSGSKVASDPRGRAITATETDEINGYALDSALNPGEIIRIVRGI